MASFSKWLSDQVKDNALGQIRLDAEPSPNESDRKASEGKLPAIAPTPELEAALGHGFKNSAKENRAGEQKPSLSGSYRLPPD